MSTFARDFSYDQLAQLAIGVAGVLRAAGVRPGDVVATELPGDLELVFMEALFHEAAIGAIYPGTVEPRNPARFDWLVTRTPSDAFPAERSVIVDDVFMGHAAEPTSIVPRVYDSFDSVCRLVFSSGTTGSPVAVPFTIRQIEGRATMADDYWMSIRPVMSLIELVGVSGFVCAYLNIARGDAYLCPGTIAQDVEMIQRLDVATLKASPAQLAKLVSALAGSGENLTSVSRVVSTGSFLPPRLVEDLARVTTGEVVNLYGSTETGTISLLPGGFAEPGDVGEIVADAEVEIVDDRGEPLPTGEEGVIRWRREFQTDAYFRNDGATRRALREGWFYPGDVGRITPDRHLHLTGRSSELINAGGVKLDPAKIDSALQSSDLVADAAVFAFPGTGGITGFSVAVVPSPAFDLEAFERLVAVECRGHQPDSIVRVEQIPRNRLGKVLRAEIARELRRELDATALGDVGEVDVMAPPSQSGSAP